MPKDSPVVTLHMRVTAQDGKRRYCRSAFTKQGQPRAQLAVVKGKLERHPEGTYYLAIDLMTTGAFGKL